MIHFGIDSRAIDAYINGKHYRAFEIFGAHKIEVEGRQGIRFCVYAPSAKSVRIVGTFNGWNPNVDFMQNIEGTGAYVIFIPNIEYGTLYKYVIETSNNLLLWKNDPYAYKVEQRIQGSTIVSDISGYSWNDSEFVKNRNQFQSYNSPINIYEVNLASWKRHPDNRYYTYRELADDLIDYVKYMGYTHIELMPVTEYPFDGSWGYQQMGYYAITSRFGTANEFMEFVDRAHQNGIGIILDWVPVHFPKDSLGLAYFDGHALYESSYYEEAYNPQWDTLNFDYNRRHVCNFMISNLVFLIEKFHIDAIRVDAVAEMIYKQYHSNSESLYKECGVSFLKEMNFYIKHDFEVLMMAEESSSYKGVTSKKGLSALGFDYKWDMGWMHDTLKYMQMDPIFRQHHHDKLTFSMMYAFDEYMILPLSHDEVVHGKKSLLDKMPGNYEEKFMQLKLLFLYQYTHPGKKLNFMGSEFGQFIEWNEWQELDWFLLEYDSHRDMQKYVKSLNELYKNNRELHEIDDSWDGFEWISVEINLEYIVTFKRIDRDKNELIVALNFSKNNKKGYQTPVRGNKYEVIFSTRETEDCNNSLYEKINDVILLDIPGLSGVILKEVK